MQRMGWWGVIFTLVVAVSLARADILHQEQSKLRQLQQKLHSYHQRLKKHVVREKSILTRLATLSRRQEELHQHLLRLGRKLQQTQQRVQILKEEHALLSDQLRIARGRLVERVRQLYTLRRFSSTPLLLFATDASDLPYKVAYMKRIVVLDSRQLSQLRAILKRVAVTRSALTAAQRYLAAYQEQIRQQQLLLTRKLQQQKRLLQRIRQDKRLVRQALQELERDARTLARLLASLRSQGLDPSRHSAIPGQLFWPVRGPLLSPFGQARHPLFNVRTTQKGIYIGAPLGSEVRAAATGRVVYADWFKGFGRLLIIDHGQHVLSLYGHVAEILVQVGDEVQSQQVIARVGMSGFLGAPALYFAIRHHAVPQDPLHWLRRRSALLME